MRRHLKRDGTGQDEAYKTVGVKIVDQQMAFEQDIVLKIRPPTIDHEVQLLKERARLGWKGHDQTCEISHVD